MSEFSEMVEVVKKGVSPEAMEEFRKWREDKGRVEEKKVVVLRPFERSWKRT